MSAEEGLQWGFFNALHASKRCWPRRSRWPRRSPRVRLSHGVTKKLLHQEWNMGLDEAIEAEAEAQAICMQTRDFRRAYDAFVAKQKPVFEGD
jgi:enoyl-CoA hydratase/carnithine racemase